MNPVIQLRMANSLNHTEERLLATGGITYFRELTYIEARLPQDRYSILINIF